MNGHSPVKAARPRPPSKPPKLREVRFDDYAQLAALAVKFGLDAEDYPAWQHLWTDNPACQSMGGKFPMGWVLEADDGSVRGYLGNVPMNYELEGRRLLAAATRSWVVESAYRSHSLLLLTTYYQQSNVDLFLATSVNSQSAVAADIFQTVRVPVGAWDRTLFWITEPKGFTESFFRKKGWGPATALSYPASLVLSMRNKIAGSYFRKAADEPALETRDGFDERFEAFWAALRRKKSKVLLGVRNREALEWHFKFPLLRRAAWIYTVENSAGIAAYGVFLRQDRRQVGLTRACLADFQCLDGGFAAPAFGAMLRAAFERCRKESVHMLELTGMTPLMEQVAERASPHHRQLANWAYFYRARDRELGRRLSSPAVWEPSLYDGDASL
jgi:hypothetical protein